MATANILFLLATKGAGSVKSKIGGIGLTAQEADKKVAKMQKRFLQTAAAAGVLATGFAAIKLKQFIAESVELADAQDRAVKALEQTIASTGNAAGFTSEQL